jgi:hypothetical protein
MSQDIADARTHGLWVRAFGICGLGRVVVRWAGSPCGRRRLRARGIIPRIARRGIAHGSGPGRHHWVVKRGFAWLHAFKPAAHALRTPRRHPPRPIPAGLRADLLPPPASSILTPLLTPPGQQARRVTELTAPPGRPAGTPWGTETATSCRRSAKQRQRGCSFGSSKAREGQPKVLGCTVTY